MKGYELHSSFVCLLPHYSSPNSRRVMYLERAFIGSRQAKKKKRKKDIVDFPALLMDIPFMERGVWCEMNN